MKFMENVGDLNFCSSLEYSSSNYGYASNTGIRLIWREIRVCPQFQLIFTSTDTNTLAGEKTSTEYSATDGSSTFAIRLGPETFYNRHILSL